MTTPKINGKSLNIQEELLHLIQEQFPEVISEGKVDPEKLKQTLGEKVETDTERYGLTWAGKSNCFREIQKTTTATLVPVPEESVNFDETKNLFIEGDNLEVLRILQRSYYGKVKMIYIDPPYNTGSDFIYDDNFKQDKTEYEAVSGQKNGNGDLLRDNALRRNSRDNGHYHSDWLNMMYPRLFLARNLLRRDGTIFVSIGDHEVSNLRLIMDEIFGEENFLGIACRVAKKSNNKGDYWSPNFDYLLTYGKNEVETPPFSGGVNEAAYTLIEDSGPRKGEKYQLVRLYMSNIQNRNPEQRFFIECPDGTKIIPPGSTMPPVRPELGDGIWRWSRKKFEEERDRIVIKKVSSSNLIDENGNPAKWNVYTKTYLNDVIKNNTAKPNSLVEDFINQIGTRELKELEIPFDYPKPAALIKFLMEISQVGDGDIVMDFFAGSGSSAHAVLEANAEDGLKRSFVIVQLPEEVDEKTEAFKAGYKNIADIAKERIRRVGKLVRDKSEQSLIQSNDLDTGFKVFKISDSNFEQWRGSITNQEELAQQLELSVDNIKPNTNEVNILSELILKSGLELTEQVEKSEEHGVTHFIVGDKKLIVCLSGTVTKEFIDYLEQTKPAKVIFLEKVFANNDDLKTNAILNLERADIDFKVV